MPALEEHSVVITGASRGIGRRIALMFARETNYSLLLLARSESDLKETEQLCKKASAYETLSYSADLSDAGQASALQLPENFPKVKVIINNAGSFLLKQLAETSPEELDDQIRNNLYSAVNVTRRFMGDLQGKKQALIVNICSEGSLKGLKDSGAYSASKHALLGYTRSLRLELMDTEIGVTAVNLGQTESSSWEGSSIEKERLIDPDDVAQLIHSLCRLSPRTVVEEILIKPKHGRVPPM